MYYHEPVRYLSHLKLVTSSLSYNIQVQYDLIKVLGWFTQLLMVH